jgi:hypothetical protein
MCVNLCKSPVQLFFTEQLGMPLTMSPNFEGMHNPDCGVELLGRMMDHHTYRVPLTQCVYFL